MLAWIGELWHARGMARKTHPNGMTPAAWHAYQVYRDLGPRRTLTEVARLTERKSRGALARWAQQYEWQELVREHDYQRLRASLAEREVQRESVMQAVVDLLPDALEALRKILIDDSVVPVLDRSGAQVIGPDGEPLWRPQVRASTRAQVAQHILGMGGVVPTKRTEVIDRSAESLDAASRIVESMTPEQVEQVQRILARGDGSDT